MDGNRRAEAPWQKKPARGQAGAIALACAAALSVFSPLAEGCRQESDAAPARTAAMAPRAMPPAAPESGRMGAPYIPYPAANAGIAPFAEAIKTSASFLDRSEAATALGSLGSGSAPALALAMLDSNSFVRGRVLEAIRRSGAEEAFSLLCLALKEDDHPVLRSEAAMQLGYLQDRRAVEPLINSLHEDPDPMVRSFSAFSLGLLGEREKSVPALNLTLRKDGYLHARISAIFALRWLGAGEAVFQLGQTLRFDPEENARYHAAHVLGEFGDPAGLDALIEAATGFWRPGDSGVKRAAIWALGQFTHASGADRQRISDILKKVIAADSSPDTRREAANALSSLEMR